MALSMRLKSILKERIGEDVTDRLNGERSPSVRKTHSDCLSQSLHINPSLNKHPDVYKVFATSITRSESCDRFQLFGEYELFGIDPKLDVIRAYR